MRSGGAERTPIFASSVLVRVFAVSFVTPKDADLRLLLLLLPVCEPTVLLCARLWFGEDCSTRTQAQQARTHPINHWHIARQGLQALNIRFGAATESLHTSLGVQSYSAVFAHTCLEGKRGRCLCGFKKASEHSACNECGTDWCMKESGCTRMFAQHRGSRA